MGWFRREISRYPRLMPHRRKPDALSDAERQRRYMRSHDLGVLKLPKPLLQRLDAIARARSISRRAAFALLIDEWEATQSGTGVPRPSGAARGTASSRRAPNKGPRSPKPVTDAGQQELFGAIRSSDTRQGD